MADTILMWSANSRQNPNFKQRNSVWAASESGSNFRVVSRDITAGWNSVDV